MELRRPPLPFILIVLAGCASRESSGGGAPASEAAERPDGGWLVIDGAEPHIDKREMILIRRAEGSLSPVDTSVRPWLTLSCTPEAFRAHIDVPEDYAPSQRGRDWLGPSVSYQIDSAKARADTWNVVIVKESAILAPGSHMVSGITDEHAVRFINRIRPASVLSFTFTPEHRDPKTVRFKLDSLPRLLERAERTCGRALRKGGAR
ncbi:MAG: hypothetical protein ABR499_20120 [Gemmatimonadaceae bacterium]